MIPAGDWLGAASRVFPRPPSLTCAITLLALSRTLTGNAVLERTACVSRCTATTSVPVALCAAASCPCAAVTACPSDAVTAGPALSAVASCCNVVMATTPTVRSRSFSRSCANWVICWPRTASWVVRAYESAVPTASATRSPPKTRPVTLAAMKTAASRVDTGQLLTERRAGLRLSRRDFLLVCRPGPRALPPWAVEAASAAGLPLGGVEVPIVISAPAPHRGSSPCARRAAPTARLAARRRAPQGSSSLCPRLCSCLSRR